jgi:hypothetical protein
MKVFSKIALTCFSVYFFIWFLLYKTGINTLPIQSEDTVPAIFTTISIVNDGTLYLDKYKDMMYARYPNPDDKSYIKGLVPFYLRKITSESGVHYISAFPIMTSIVSLPVFYIPLKLGLDINWENMILLSHIASSLILALSVGFFYLLLRDRFNLSNKNTWLLVFIYAFGTINFALVSQALWQYGTLQLFLILGLYFSYSKNLFLSGLFSGFSFITRPTSILPVMFNPIVGNLKSIGSLFTKKGFTKENVTYHLKRLVPFVIGFSIPLLFFIWYNNVYYKDISNQGYADQLFGGWLSHFPEGFLGIWLSPSKGILVYSPVLIFSLFGLYISIKSLLNEKIINFSMQNIIFGTIVFLHVFIMGFWKHWYGGYSFGYRMASDVIPYLVLMLMPFLQSKYFDDIKYKRIRLVFFVLLIVSVLVQLHGMVFFDGIWHAAFDKGFRDTSWLWSITDSEFMFNIRRVLVKLGMLDKACSVCL